METDDLAALQQEARRFNAGMNGIVQNMPTIALDNLEIRLQSFHMDVIPPGIEVREHEHPNYELAFIERGGMTSMCDDVKISCTSRNGRIFLMPPMTLHHRRFDNDINIDRAMIFSIAGTDEAGRQLCRQLPSMIREKGFSGEATASLTFMRDELLRQLAARRPLAPEVARHCLRAFLALFFQENFPELFDSAANALMPLAGLSDADRIVEIKRFVEHVMNSPASLEKFEKRFGLSGRHLNRIFKQAAGVTLGDYVAQRKLAHAENLLLGSNASVTEVAKALGFKNLTMFSIFFHKRKGCSPTSFREAARRRPCMS